MLPDYPEIKRRIHKSLTTRMQTICNGPPPFSDVGRQTLFEGNRNKIVRNDGTISDSTFEEISSKISIDLDNYENMTFDEILNKIDQCALDMAKQQSQYLFQTIDEAVKSVGNTIDCKGEIFNPDHIFRMLDKITIDFNSDGTPNMPLLVVGAPEVGNKWIEVQETIENTPELKKIMEELIDKKRMEWLDRENSRKLVG